MRDADTASLVEVATERTGTVREVEIEMCGDDHDVGSLTVVVGEQTDPWLEFEAAEAFGRSEIAVSDNESVVPMAERSVRRLQRLVERRRRREQQFNVERRGELGELFILAHNDDRSGATAQYHASSQVLHDGAHVEIAILA